MIAADIRDALHKRWPPDQYVVIEEAPDDPMRMGRKLDMLAISLWASRGYELEGVEIKVSVSDWHREVKEPQKADWWWRHVHRFWVAVPTAIAGRVRADLPGLPGGWGLLVVNDAGGVRALVPAEKHPAEPMTWKTSVGLMRAAMGIGVNHLARARDAGYNEAKAAAAKRVDRLPGLGLDPAQRKLDELTAKVQAFKDATGLDIEACRWGHDAARLGHYANLARTHMHDPTVTTQRLRNAAMALTEEAKRVGDVASSFDDLFGAALSQEPS